MIIRFHYYLYATIALMAQKGYLNFLSLFNPRHLGFLLSLILRPVLKSQVTLKSGKNLLCLDRLVFQRDLKILKKSSQFNFISMNSICFGQILSIYIPVWMRHQILFPDYINREENFKTKQNIINFTNGFISGVQKYLKIDCGILAGIDYLHDYSFQLVFKNEKIPFIVLFYENFTIPSVQYTTVNLYKDFEYKFYGNAIATFSSKTFDVFAGSEVFPKEKIFITGAPRLDVWRKSSPTTTPPNNIVLFSYPGFEYGAHLNFVHVLHEFAKASTRCTNNRNFIVKCKNKNHKNDVEEYLKGLHHRLNILIDIELHDLLIHAKAVIAFNSLTCLEALMSNAHVYIPFYGDSHLPHNQLQIVPDDITNNISGLTFIKKPQDLATYIQYECEDNEVKIYDHEKRLNFLKDYFYHSKTTTNSENLENVIASVLQTTTS